MRIPVSNASDYTEESWKVFADALQKARAVLQDESATEQQVQDALAALNSARRSEALMIPLMAMLPMPLMTRMAWIWHKPVPLSCLVLRIVAWLLTGVIVARVRREMR